MAKSIEGQAPKKWRGRWRASVLAGYDGRGKQQRKYCYGKTRQECLENWNELKKRQKENTLPAEKDMTVKQWFDHWLLVKSKQVVARTIEEYSFTLRYVLPRIGRIKLNKLTALDVQKMQLDVLDAVSTRAAYHSRRLVYNALEDAMRFSLVHRNVAALVKPVKYEKKDIVIWTGDEVLRFLEKAKGSLNYALFYTALTTGMRPGELIALHWTDIEDNKIHVKHNVSMVKNKAILGPPKTKRGKRILTLGPDTIEVLEQHREDLRLRGLDDVLVFPSKNGTFLQHTNILKSLRTYIEKAEVTNICAHDLRHTYVSMRIAGGVDIIRVSREIGHANASFTLDTYAHLFSKRQDHEAPSLLELVGAN